VTLEVLPVRVVVKDGEPGEAARAAFAELEAALRSLRGRRFYRDRDPKDRRYVACALRRDHDDLPGFDGGILLCGLRPNPPARGRMELYEQIGPTFDRVAASIAVGPSRPWLEHYRSKGEVDVLVPIREVRSVRAPISQDHAGRRPKRLSGSPRRVTLWVIVPGVEGDGGRPESHAKPRRTASRSRLQLAEPPLVSVREAARRAGNRPGQHRPSTGTAEPARCRPV
jgi:hypothetical protein